MPHEIKAQPVSPNAAAFPMSNPVFGVANASHHPHLIQTVQHCAATCEHMVSMLAASPDVHARTQQIQFLRDCADICYTTARFLARGGHFTGQIAALCALICETCGNECAKFPDAHSQHCAQICLRCAHDCRRFA